jgi:hypothetical protein
MTQAIDAIFPAGFPVEVIRSFDGLYDGWRHCASRANVLSASCERLELRVDEDHASTPLQLMTH